MTNYKSRTNKYIGKYRVEYTEDHNQLSAKFSDRAEAFHFAESKNGRISYNLAQKFPNHNWLEMDNFAK